MRELIIDYLDGNLSGELKEFVASHIKKTDKWKLEFEQLQEVHDVIDSTEPLDPPAGMKQEFEKLMREANDEKLCQANKLAIRKLYFTHRRFNYSFSSCLSNGLHVKHF